MTFAESKSEDELLAENFQRLASFLKAEEQGTFFTGHASLLAKVRKMKLLFDPVSTRPLFLDSWLFFPDLVINEELLRQVDGIFVSHCHEDHYDPGFLKKVGNSVPIFIPEARTGFDEITSDKSLNVQLIPPWELTEIAPGVEVLCLPSDHNDFDSSFIVKGSDFAVFQGNDNFLNFESITRAKEIVGKVNHAYVPYAYIWWYPFCLKSLTPDERKTEALRLSTLNMRIGSSIAELFEADLVVPSAANLVFFESADSILNREIASSYDFVRYVKANHPAIADKTVALFAGDYVLHTDQGQKVFTKDLAQDEFFERLDRFLMKVNQAQPPVRPRSELSEIDLRFLKDKIRGVELESIEIDIFFRRADIPKWSLKISMRDYNWHIVEDPSPTTGSITFDIQEHAFEWWLDGKVTLETILNSQRFSVFRNPEVFEPKVWSILRSHF